MTGVFGGATAAQLLVGILLDPRSLELAKSAAAKGVEALEEFLRTQTTSVEPSTVIDCSSGYPGITDQEGR